MRDTTGPLAHRRSREETGASAVEYALLISGVAALIVVVLFAFGGTVDKVFQGSCSTIKGQASVAATCS